ncbi:hypothetical protein DFJ74DRAFT_710445 [Hyaloraphidium curvatum]|nr:hypothetical protein DFJ74DRAFT_710445 [Hyaloraphidium curvatum]
MSSQPSFPDVQRLDGRTAPLSAVLAALRDDGCVIVEHAIAPEDADAIAAEMAPHIARASRGGDAFAGRNTVRCGALAARSPAFNRSVLVNKVLLGAADEHLLPNCKRYALHDTQVIKIGPKSPAQVLHRDRNAWNKWLPESIEPMVATLWALSDFTKENGATAVIPRSHRRPLLDFIPDPEGRDVRYAAMPKGSCVMYLGSTIHGGGANTTEDQWRLGMHVSFSLGWLRSEENQYLSVPPDIARTLPPAVQELVGYGLVDRSLGYFSPPTERHLPPFELPDPSEGLLHEMPYGTDCLAPEMALGRRPRSWKEQAGVNPGMGIGEGTSAQVGPGRREAASKL